jgi:hypothetical protein
MTPASQAAVGKTIIVKLWIQFLVNAKKQKTEEIK